MATSKRTRIFMGFLAGLFLVTSSALTIGVILESAQSDDQSQTETTDPATQDMKPKISCRARS